MMTYTKDNIFEMFEMLDTYNNPCGGEIIYNEIITNVLLNMGFINRYGNTIMKRLTQDELLCSIRYIKILSVEGYINSILSRDDVKKAKKYSILKFLDNIKYSDINISTCGHFIVTPTINKFFKTHYQLIGDSNSGSGGIFYSKKPLVLSEYYLFFINYFSDDVLYQENDVVDILEDIIMYEV